jgi:hypothetical protein
VDARRYTIRIQTTEIAPMHPGRGLADLPRMLQAALDRLVRAIAAELPGSLAHVALLDGDPTLPRVVLIQRAAAVELAAGLAIAERVARRHVGWRVTWREYHGPLPGDQRPPTASAE